MNFLDYLKGGIIGLIIGMMLAGIGVWWAKDQQVKAVKVELQTAKDANASLEKAKELLKEEVAKMDQSCTARVNSKDKTIKKLKEINNLKPGEVSNATDNNTVGSNSGDPILDALNGMWKQSDKQDGVHQADDTGTAGETRLLPGQVGEKVIEGLYCLDAENAKNLLKNKTLADDFVEQHRAIIEGLR